ncbi:ELMO/CED-12 family [Geosmithia morbida]|uniref:ELMO/CED-12 family n=1 Tax=Geosmithia morbida TaxID=1094350 RepID=A0A9P4YUV5_9HYPO|nr:ELMO/CED-12 family [Geosmithia morbida]KAF4123531.1 ELMO/CED-12 family [Geosmithia morbida]
MDQADIPALLSRMASDEDASRKMAVFKLQSSINDPAFADVFISSGGLVVLRRLIMSSSGNTLAYSLQSLTRLLEVDMGWDVFEGPTASDLVERIVELIVKNPLVNILRGAMSILVSLVSHSQSAPPEISASASAVSTTAAPGAFGFRALKPAVAVHPQFLELVIHQLQSADHALCGIALMLINALIRDALSSADGVSISSSVVGGGGSSTAGNSNGSGDEWLSLIKKLHDLGLVKAVCNLMRSSALQDLAHPMLEFQTLTKVLLRKWRDIRVDLERSEHRRALKSLHLASNPDWSASTGGPGSANGSANGNTNGHSRDNSRGSKRHNPEKWRRLGFETESPSHEFETAGYLGLMDLADYVRKYEGGFQKLLLEQASQPLRDRLPVARASLSVTMMLYRHFEVGRADLEDARNGGGGGGGGGGGYGYRGVDMSDHDSLFKPLLLQWSRLHAAGLHAFFRMWKATGARGGDFDKVAELVRILIDHVVGHAPRTRDVMETEDDMHEYDVARLRQLQMDMLRLSFEDKWGKHLVQVRDELTQEALHFVKEQRVRCLLHGSWFARPPADGSNGDTHYLPWRFAKLSHNKRFLHYADFAQKPAQDPVLGNLPDKVDLGTVSSVVSNVSSEDPSGTQATATATTTTTTTTKKSNSNSNSNSSSSPSGMTKITINTETGGREKVLLTLWPPTHSQASEWLDGLLMLLGQAPITSDTNKLVNLVSDYGLKIRMLNVNFGSAFQGPPPGAGVVPSRKGLDNDYFFDV